jgi:hypothetical protein
MEHVLGTVAAPSHPWTVEAHADQVAHRSLDGATSDVEVVAAQSVVVHAVLVFGEMLADLLELVSLDLGAGPGLGDAVVGGGQRAENVTGSAPAAKLADTSPDPCGQLGRTFDVEAGECQIFCVREVSRSV